MVSPEPITRLVFCRQGLKLLTVLVHCVDFVFLFGEIQKNDYCVYFPHLDLYALYHTHTHTHYRRGVCVWGPAFVPFLPCLTFSDVTHLGAGKVKIPKERLSDCGAEGRRSPPLAPRRPTQVETLGVEMAFSAFSHIL